MSKYIIDRIQLPNGKWIKPTDFSKYKPEPIHATGGSGSVMTFDRAIEILDPEHREHYDSIEIVNEACRMGMSALKRCKPTKPINNWDCPNCHIPVIGYNFCPNCGQAIDRMRRGYTYD